MSESLHAHYKKAAFFTRALQNKFGDHSISILEIGCSNGENLAFKIAAENKSVTGVDIHLPSIQYAENKKNKNCRFICKNIFELSIEVKYDAVILSDILEHIEYPSRLLEKSLELLKDDGLLLICIPNGFGLYEIENFILKKLYIPQIIAKIKPPKISIELPYNHDSGHIQFFTEKYIKNLLKNAGFRILSQQNGGFLGGFLTDYLARKLRLVERLFKGE